jgi:ribosomal protein S18 acetylase RimI-like enzyme
VQDNYLEIIPAWRAPIDYWEIWDFFRYIEDDPYFQPHPFKKKDAQQIQGVTQNQYYLLVKWNSREQIHYQIIGYGFLRGWEEGWDDICLGVIIHPAFRANGYGELLVRFLHCAARNAGLSRIRLHVNPDNTKAYELYKKLGYTFEDTRENGELIGYVGLHNCRGMLQPSR